ncbi:MAG: Rieske 2Fe-2S domain-containing protein [Pseudomonadota bacterium]
MSHIYKPVGWDRSKIVYDLVLIAAAGAFLFLYLRIAPGYAGLDRPFEDMIARTHRIQAFGLCAFLMLSVILCIGPLARLDPRFLPLLYNRRHFGVLTAAVAFAHIGFVLDWYFAFAPIGRWEGLFTANVSYGQLLGFPFELFGLAAFVILMVLALTSHDFWMRFLTPRVWKGVHMTIYAAYALVVAHVAFGYLQSSDGAIAPAVVVGAASVVCVLHLLAAGRERRIDGERRAIEAGWMSLGPWPAFYEETPLNRAKIVSLPDGERVAVFRHARGLSAVSNVCAHQQGPLGEGRILPDGCITCPWHGFQFDPETGCAPPPFDDRIETYRLRLTGETIELETAPQPLGAKTPSLPIAGAPQEG